MLVKTKKRTRLGNRETNEGGGSGPTRPREGDNLSAADGTLRRKGLTVRFPVFFTTFLAVSTFGTTVHSAVLEYCLTYPASGVYELWITGVDNADHSGVSGFSVILSRTVESFSFDPLFVDLQDPSTATTGFDVLGSGEIGTQYNIYGIQTPRPPNLALYDLSVLPVVTTGQTAEMSYAVPLRVGSGTYKGLLRPVIAFQDSSGNVFNPARDAGTFASVISADYDNDGLPGCWEAHFFGDPLSVDPHEDADGDGVTNLEEHLAGTDPTQSESVFHIERIVSQTDGSIHITFDTTPGRLYSIQHNNNLNDEGGWTNMKTHLPGDGSLRTFIDASPHEDPGCFRVGITFP